MPLLEIKDLSLEWRREEGSLRVLDGVSLDIQAGETVCLVGESGSGKSVTALSIARLLAEHSVVYPTGEILLNGKDVLKLPKARLREIRGKVVSYIFQEPSASLNPVLRIGAQIMEVLKVHRPGSASKEEVMRLLRLVGIASPETRWRQYPHEFSGGMQQRVMIAMAIAAEPALLVADEPTTGLDVTIQSQIIDLLQRLKAELGMSMLFITHNLGVVSEIADRVLVMYAGQIVEAGPAARVLSRPAHPYTRALLRSAPALGSDRAELITIEGAVPQPGAFPAGCRFHPRCFQRQPDCDQFMPKLEPVGASQSARCPYWNLPETHD